MFGLRNNVKSNESIIRVRQGEITCPQGLDMCSGINSCCQPNDQCLPDIGPEGLDQDNDCDNNFMMQCSGFSDDLGTDIDSVINFWNQRLTGSGHNNGFNCKNYYVLYLNTLPTISGAFTSCSALFNPDTYDDSGCYINNLFTLYTDTYKFTDDVTDPQYNEFQWTLSNLCGSDSDGISPPQGGCDRFLSNYCSQFSRNEIAESLILLNLCGCYAPLDNISGISDNPESRSCDSLCHLVGTTQLYDSSTGGQFICQANVCVIADTTIIASQTKIGGSVTFQQVCPGCSANQPCKCIITNVTVSNGNSKEFQSSINSACGTGSVCYMVDSAGNSNTVPCTSLEPPPLPFYQTSLFITIISIIILGFVILIIIILVIISGKSQKIVSVTTPAEKEKYSIITKALSQGNNIREIHDMAA